jgi:hypothetical protein
MKKIVSILAFTILSLVVFSQTEGKWYKLKFVNSSGEKQVILFKGLASAIELQSHLNGGIAFVGATSFTKEFVPMGTNLSKTVSVNQFVSINTAAMTLFREIQNQSHGEDGFLSTTTPNIFAVADGSLKKLKGRSRPKESSLKQSKTLQENGVWNKGKTGIFSQEALKKIGKLHSKESYEKTSLTLLGRKQTPEHKLNSGRGSKLAWDRRKKEGWRNTYRHSEEMKELIRQKSIEFHKRVKQERLSMIF